MVLNRSLFFILTVAALVTASCTKPILIGSDFLENEKALLQFRDDFQLSFFTEKTDSVIVHSESVVNQLFIYLLGNVNDPIFGNYSSEIYAQPLLAGPASVLSNSTIDSVVLQLKYDTLGTYGDISSPVTIEVRRMTENPPFREKYYSDEQFEKSPELLGSAFFVPNPRDSVDVLTATGTITVAPHVRIPLSTSVMSELLTQPTSVLTNLDSFLNYFNGLHISMSGSDQTMLGFNLLNQVSGVTYYYHKDSSATKEFKFIFTTASVKTAYYQHDYSGSFVEPSLSAEPEIDYWFVQGMAGLTTGMKIEDLNTIGPAIINQAEIEVYCSFPAGDVPEFFPPIKYLVTQEKTDSSFVNSLDVNLALSRSTFNVASSAFKLLYGGSLELVSAGPPAVYRYNMKVTSQVRDIFLGEKENVIYFNPFEKANFPNRSVMYGPSHPTYAPRLRIYYTAL